MFAKAKEGDEASLKEAAPENPEAESDEISDSLENEVEATVGIEASLK